MKKLLLGAALAASMLVAAPAANAATNIVLPPAGADGTIIGGYTEAPIGAGAFSYEYTFTFPTAGNASTFLSSIGVTSSTNVDFTNVVFNGVSLNIVNGTLDTAGVLNGLLQKWAVDAGVQTLLVEGVSGGNGEFTVDIAFAPVPEPATWAMMIIGFGAAGVMVRARRKLVPTVA